jgi:hypothetical protein
MSAFAARVLAVGRPMASASYVWAPLLGAGWVTANVMLIVLATEVSHPFVSSLIAGVLDGMILSIVAVAKASARFQSLATGLLSGVSLSGLRRDGSMISYAIGAIHELVDKALDGWLQTGSEDLHMRILNATVNIIWITTFVLMASLIMEWVKDARLQAERVSS